MSLHDPVEIIGYAAKHNIRLLAENGKLILESDFEIPDELVNAARQHKPEILEALTSPKNPLFVYRFRVDGKTVTTYSEHDPSDFLAAMLMKFGRDRRITILEQWPIWN